MLKKISLKKILILILLALSCILFCNQNSIFAENSSDNTYIYPVYNNNSGYFADLSGITAIDINSKYLVYSTGATANSLNILKLSNYEKSVYTNLDRIKYLKIIDNYLFIIHGDTPVISIYSLSSHQPINLITASGTNYILPSCNSVCIRKIQNTANNNYQIIIATTNSTNTSISISWFDLQTLTQTNVSSPVSFDETISKITLSDKKIFIVCSDRLYSLSLNVFPTATSKSDFTSNYFPTGSITSLDYINVNSSDYLVATTSLCLNLIETNMTESGSVVKIGENSDDAMSLGIIKNPIDVKVFNDLIYVADSTTKAIQSFSINSNASAFSAEKILITSNCKDKGWFNSNTQLNVTSSNNMVSTYCNSAGDKNRVQIITPSAIISPTHFDDSVYSSFANAKISDTHLVFTSVKNSNEGALFLYQYDEQNSLLNLPITAISSKILNSEQSNMSIIRDFVIINNLIYAIDENNLLMMTYRGSSAGSTMTCVKSVGDEDFISSTISLDAKMCYLKNVNLLLIYSNNRLYTMTLNGEIQGNFTFTNNCLSICADNNDNIFILTNNATHKTIQKYNVLNNQLENSGEVTGVENIIIENISNLTVQAESGILYGFDNVNCSPVTISNPEFNIIYNPATVITINQKVSFYKTPILENGENNSNIKKSLPINCTIDLYSRFPITYNNRQFYIVKNSDSTFSYINKTDVVTDSDDYIKTLLVPNGIIRILDDSTCVNVYDNQDFEGEVIDTLKDGTEICVLNYSKEGNFALIKYYDDLQIEHNGYVHITYIKLNGITQTQIIILILLSCTLALAIILAIFFYKMKHPRTRI